ncbi:MAG: WXG100 family type VII secretion target [Segniliparus sp.]|uniref:WXG100 family type VII secretion target n=1 Tax=Segniliparus sp. TaxID=2804064 RepID=UPI003F3E2CA2
MKASSEQIAATAQFAASKAEEIASGVNSFSNEVDEFCGSGWQGQASDAFKPPFDEWKSAMLDIGKALQSTSERLGQASRDYAHQEHENKEQLQQPQQHIEQIRSQIQGRA